MSAKTHRVGLAAYHSHPENALVESERAVEIRDLQPHSAQVRCFGEAVFAGAYSPLPFRFSLYLTCRHFTLPWLHCARPSWYEQPPGARMTLRAANATPRAHRAPVYGPVRMS